MTEEIHLRYDRYTRLVDRLAALEPCPFVGKITPDQIKVAIGETGDIWPDSIRADLAELLSTPKDPSAGAMKCHGQKSLRSLLAMNAAK